MPRRIRNMLLLSLVLTLVAAWAAGWRAASGVVVGTPVGIFNYWLVASSITATTKPAEAMKNFMGRSFLRMFIVLMVLALTSLGGVEFFLGAAAGLTLQMLVQFLEAMMIIRGRG